MQDVIHRGIDFMEVFEAEENEGSREVPTLDVAPGPAEHVNQRFRHPVLDQWV